MLSIIYLTSTCFSIELPFLDASISSLPSVTRCKIIISQTMNKCEHGQKITTFCASQCCVWKEAAGCESCIKKYHNHMGTTVFLGEEDINALVKKYTMDSSIKPKCRVLQEAIYAYFNLIKSELSSSLDAACKNIINQIGYPYLYTNSTLSTYKRLKNKEYKKLIQKDFRALYELSQKINEKDLAREEAKIYVNQMHSTEELITNLDGIVNRYETVIKKYHSSFTHDTTHISKINDIFRNLTESPRSSQVRSHREDREKDREREKDKKQFSPVYHFKDKVEKTDSKESSFKLEPVKLGPPPKLAERVPSIISSPSVKPNYSRDVSLDRRIVKEHRFLGVQPSTPGSASKNGSRQIEGKQLISSQKSERMQVVRQELNTKQQEINQKKKMLMQMMKTKQTKPTQPHPQVISQSKDMVFSRPKVLDLKGISNREAQTRTVTLETQLSRGTDPSSREPEIKSASNNESSSQGECEDESYKKHHAFTQLPVQEKVIKKIEEMEKIKQKVIVIPTTKDKDSMELHSPLYKIKNILDRYKDGSKLTESNIQRIVKGEQRIITEEFSEPLLDLIPIYHKKSETLLELKENEEKSLALLLKALKLKAEEAIVHLEKALSFADSNLSAAEYLSFLYLELDRPTDCLKLCNKMLQKLENSSEPQQLSLILNNNKSAAFNMLGRYSESIVLLEKCLRYREKDYFYKNLGDAYYSISIYEKAIYNYQKTLKLNDHHDEAHYNLAVCLYSQENYHNAKLSILKAIEINSSNENYHELKSNIQTKITHT